MRIDKETINKAILDIKNLQQKYCRADIMFIYHGLDTALKEIGWAYSELLGGGSPERTER